MTRMLETYRKACSWFIKQAEALNTTSRAKLNRETYRQACELFDATSNYHAKRLQDLAGGSCRQGSMEVLSNNIFFDGRKVRWRKERWAARRAALQQVGRLSRVKKETSRETRWMRYINHCISKIIGKKLDKY